MKKLTFDVSTRSDDYEFYVLEKSYFSFGNNLTSLSKRIKTHLGLKP